MSESSPPYLPTTIAKVFELLDNKLVSLGIPGALAFVGITKARESQWTEAAGCFAEAVGVWLVIKIGNKLAPKLDQGLDWLIATGERSLQPLWEAEEVDPADWLRQMIEVSELLVEREPGEYEFPHLSFQGYFAATWLAQAQNPQARQANAELASRLPIGLCPDRDRVSPRRGRFINIVGFANRFSHNLPLQI